MSPSRQYQAAILQLMVSWFASREIRMPNVQHVNNRSLYQAAQKNNLSDVLRHLKNGAEVVDIRNNGSWSAEAVFHTYGFDENINLSSALHYALKYRHIEMVAHLTKSAQKNDVIDGALYRYAAYLDKNIASFLYVQSLTNPSDVLKQLAHKSAAEKSGTMKLKRSASRDAENPSRFYELQGMMFFYIRMRLSQARSLMTSLQRLICRLESCMTARVPGSVAKKIRQ